MFGKMRKRFLRMAANVDAGGDNPQDESVQYALEALEILSAVEELRKGELNDICDWRHPRQFPAIYDRTLP